MKKEKNSVFPEMKNVLIRLRTCQNISDGDTDNMDFLTEGLYTFEDDVGYITYLESPVTGLEGTRTSLYITPDRIVVDRDGSLSSRMVFKEGLSDKFLYNTPYGTAQMNIRTKSIQHHFDKNGGSAEIDYFLDMQQRYSMMNKFTINVEDIGEKNV